MDPPEPDKRPTRSPEPTIEQARAFCAVADKASYKEAALQLRQKDHAAVIRLVSRFTKVLGHGRLVEPAGQGKIRLTPIGLRVLPAARGFYESATELAALRPEIRFSAYPTIAGRMAQACPELLEQDRPLVLKNISEANRRDGGLRMVRDVAVRRLDMAIAPAGVEQDELSEREVYEWRLRVVLPKGVSEKIDALRALPSVEPKDIADLRIAVAPYGHLSREMVRTAFDTAGVPLKIALESPNQELLKAVALRGTKFAALMPDDAFDAVEVDHEAPHLRVKQSSRKFKGKYSLYTRKPEELPGGTEPSMHEQAIAAVAQQLIDAFEEKSWARGYRDEVWR